MLIWFLLFLKLYHPSPGAMKRKLSSVIKLIPFLFRHLIQNDSLFNILKKLFRYKSRIIFSEKVSCFEPLFPHPSPSAYSMHTSFILLISK
jgi:hypothetical protein